MRSRRPADGVVSAAKMIEAFAAASSGVIASRVILSDSLGLTLNLAENWRIEPRPWMGMKVVHHPERDLAVVYGLGLGGPATAMTIELLAEAGAEHIIHLGTAASIKNPIEPGTVLVVEAAFRDEGTSQHYLPAGSIVTFLGPEIKKWPELLSAKGFKSTRGPVWSTDAVFRETPEKIENFAQRGALAVEMESAAAYAVADFCGVNMVCLRIISDHLSSEQWRPYFSHQPVREARRRLLNFLATEEWI